MQCTNISVSVALLDLYPSTSCSVSLFIHSDTNFSTMSRCFRFTQRKTPSLPPSSMLCSASQNASRSCVQQLPESPVCSSYLPSLQAMVGRGRTCASGRINVATAKSPPSQWHALQYKLNGYSTIIM